MHMNMHMYINNGIYIYTLYKHFWYCIKYIPENGVNVGIGVTLLPSSRLALLLIVTGNSLLIWKRDACEWAIIYFISHHALMCQTMHIIIQT